MSRPAGQGGPTFTIDPILREDFRRAIHQCLSVAPWEPHALDLASQMGADLLAATPIAQRAGWTRPQFEAQIIAYWLNAGINPDAVIDASGFGDMFTLRALALDAAATFALNGSTDTPYEA